MSRRLALPALVTALGVAILLGLGGWQWQRLGEKQALIATIAERTKRTPVPFPAPAEWPGLKAQAISYLPVTLTGTFDHGREAHVFFALAKPKNGLSGPGYLVITPLMLAGGGTVLVNRGFVPAERKDATHRAAGNGAVPATLTGLIRLPEARGAFSGADDPVKNIFYVRDPAALAAARGVGPVAPVIVDLTGPEPAGGLPMPGATQIEIPNNHLGYALTWWSLAGALAVIFGLFARARPD